MNNKDFRDDESSLVDSILDFIQTFAICAICIVVFSTIILRPCRVSGSSMAPNLEDGQFGFSNVIGYIAHGIERYDVVMIKVTEDGKSRDIVKRVIALPNETISCKDDVVYVDGEALDESYYLSDELKQKWIDDIGHFTPDFDEVTLGDDEYFVLGDNRAISNDSTELGPINKSQIFAKDFLIVFPFSDIHYV